MCVCAPARHAYLLDMCESSDLTELADFLLFSLVSQVVDGALEAVFKVDLKLERASVSRRIKRHSVRFGIGRGYRGAPLPARPLLSSSVPT